jgi:hypothetical protein
MMNRSPDVLIRYRALHELRRIFSPNGSMKQKLVFGASALMAASGPLVAAHLCSVLCKRLPPGGSPAVFIFPGTIIAFLLCYLTLIPELLREIGFARDLELLRVAPVRPAEWIAYRLLSALYRNFGPEASVIAFPVYCAWMFSKDRYHLWFHLLLIIACSLCLFLLSLWTSVVFLCISDRWGISRHVLFAGTSLVLIAGSCSTLPYLIDPGGWSGFARRSQGYMISTGCLSAALILLIISACLAWKSTVQLWPLASKPAERRTRRLREFLGQGSLFSTDHSLAVFQKDLKDLARNPSYRYNLLICIVLLSYMAIVGWLKSPPPGKPTWARLMFALSFVYIVPFLFSARSVSLESRMLQFYRLIFPSAGWVLDQKWKVQSLLNILIVSILALPLFPLVHGGAKSFEPAYYAGCVVVFVPLLTMLALALGTFFASTSTPPNVFGIRPLGGMIYFLLAIVLYSFLLNYMYPGTLLYSLFLIPLTAFLYIQARKAISRPQ